MGWGSAVSQPPITIPTQLCHSPADPRHSLLLHQCATVIHLFFFPVRDIFSLVYVQNSRRMLMWTLLAVSFLNTSALLGVELMLVCQKLRKISPFALFHWLTDPYICFLLWVQHKLGCHWAPVRSCCIQGSQAGMGVIQHRPTWRWAG